MRFKTQMKEPFFLYFPWFILLFVVLSFGGKAVLDTADLPPITPLHHLHALTMLAWFGLFALQPTLIHFERRDLHRLVGRLSPLVVLAFIVAAVPITTLNWDRVGEPIIVTSNFLNLLVFLGLYLAAILWRKSPAAHMRLMVYASLMLMGPAGGRIAEIFDWPIMWSAPIVLGLQIAPMVHDIILHRRVHPAVWSGFVLVLVVTALILTLSGLSAWIAFLESILGPRPITG